MDAPIGPVRLTEWLNVSSSDTKTMAPWARAVTSHSTERPKGVFGAFPSTSHVGIRSELISFSFAVGHSLITGDSDR
jgi:hypothetical protein